MRVASWPIAKVKPYPGNPRKITDAAVGKVAHSITEFGFNQPIVVDMDGVIIAGHTRLLASKSLKLKQVPVLQVDLPEEKARAYRIADNRTAEEAQWVDDLLRVEFDALRGLDMDLTTWTGFNPSEIAGIFRSTGFAGGDPEEAPEPPVNPVSRFGDVWQLGKHRVVCGDSTTAESVALAIGDCKPVLMVTDPPYGVSYDPEWRTQQGVNLADPKNAAMGKVLNDDRADWSAAYKLFTGDVMYVWHPGLRAAEFMESIKACGFNIRSQIIWNKSMLLIGRGDYHWKHEPCWYAVRAGKVGRFVGGRKQSTVWDIDKQRKSETGHSTQKPVECMKRPIDNSSKPGEIVYEPFAGSGTTIIAAEIAARICRAVELNPAYVDVCVRRWQEFTGGVAMLGDRSFEEVEKDRAKQEDRKARKASKRPAASASAEA